MLLRSCSPWLSAPNLCSRVTDPKAVGPGQVAPGARPELIVTRNKRVIARAFYFQEKLEMQTFRKHCLISHVNKSFKRFLNSLQASLCLCVGCSLWDTVCTFCSFPTSLPVFGCLKAPSGIVFMVAPTFSRGPVVEYRPTCLSLREGTRWRVGYEAGLD